MEPENSIQQKQALLENIRVAIFEHAEQIAKEYTSSEANLPIDVTYNEHTIELRVDVMIINHESEEETNSVSYNTEVFCVGYVLTDDIDVNTMIIEDIYLETLYQD